MKKNSHDEEKELATASLSGDIDAFSELVGRHQDVVYNLAYRLCGNSATAEDMAQEAFVRAYQKLHQYQPSLSFRNWVLGICANLCRSRHRWWHREKKKQQAYAVEMAIRDETKENISRHDHAEEYEKLERALAALPVKLRGPLVLKYMEGMSVQEVATVLGIRLGAVKMRLARGRERMKELMKQQTAAESSFRRQQNEE